MLMFILKIIHNRIFLGIFLLILLGVLSSCGIGKIWDPGDARKVSPNVNDRVAKNLEEGKGWSIDKATSKKSGTSYEFASSNPMWRATLEILDFLPLSNVDYIGGIITTDWYNEGTTDESIKITVRFLSNEIRSDGIKIVVHKKKCGLKNNCSVKKISSKLEQELRLAILKKAVLFQKDFKSKKKKFKSPGYLKK